MDLQQSKKNLLFLLIFLKVVKIFQNYIDTGFMLYPRESQKTLACVAGQSLFEDANRTDTHVPSISILPR